MTRPVRSPGVAIPGHQWNALDGMRSTEPPTVSVVIVHYEQHDDLARALGALERQTHPRSLIELIVVDDGSSEPPHVPDGVTLLVQEDRGFRAAAARNLGAAAATGDILCFLDADCAPEPGYLEAITRLPALAADAVCVGRRRHAVLDGVAPGAPLDALPASLVLDEPAWLADAYRRSGDLLHADARSYRFVIGALLACRRDFFAEVGGFDESFTAYGGEDWEWASRAWRHGAVLAHVPDAVAWHNGPDAGRRSRSAAEWNDETLRLAQRIPVDGGRPHALMTEDTDVEVHLAAPMSSAQAIVAADSILRLMPTAHVYLGDDVPALAADPRVRRGTPPAAAPLSIVVHAPLRVHPDAPLREVVERTGRGTVGDVHVVDADGALLSATASRVAARRARWGDDVAVDVDVPAHGVARRVSDPEPDLAAYFGDW